MPEVLCLVSLINLCMPLFTMMFSQYLWDIGFLSNFCHQCTFDRDELIVLGIGSLKVMVTALLLC